jgi:mercuric ion binding protein
MKSFKLFLLSFFLVALSGVVSAQTKTEKIPVSGECGTCKKKIETAAKKAGASYASWDIDSKQLTVKYTAATTNTTKIEQAIAAVGYDTRDVKASDKAYEALDGCCQYERTSANEAKSCCDDAKCATEKCMKNGKCTAGMSCCKESGCTSKDCCKKG